MLLYQLSMPSAFPLVSQFLASLRWFVQHIEFNISTTHQTSSNNHAKCVAILTLLVGDRVGLAESSEATTLDFDGLDVGKSVFAV